MKKIILTFAIMTRLCFPFVELQYMDTPPAHFEFFASMATMGLESNGQSPPSIGFYGVNYRFDNIGYGFNIYPVQLSNGDTFSWTSHNLYAQLYENYPALFTKASLQVGVINLGLPQSALKSSKFTNYLQSFYITNKFKITSQINVYISSGPRGDGQAYYHRSVLEYTYNGNRGFLEFSPNQNQLYIGGEVNISKDIIFTIGSNLSDSNPDINGDYFYPSTIMGVRLINPFIKPKETPKQIPPVDIDMEAYISMEKGLIAYYESNYKEALQHYLTVLKKYPTFSLAYVRAGNTCYKLKQISQAKKYWQTALTLDPKNQDVLEMLSRLQNNNLLKDSLIDD